MRWWCFSSWMCKVHMWSVSTRDIHLSIFTSITVSKATTNLTKHDCKLIKTLHKWKIMIWTVRYYKIEHICTDLYWNHALLWVILTKQSNMRLLVSWIDDYGSGNYKYPWGMETNGMPESWSQETWKDMVTNEQLGEYVRVCLSDIGFAKSQHHWNPTM